MTDSKRYKIVEREQDPSAVNFRAALDRCDDINLKILAPGGKPYMLQINGKETKWHGEGERGTNFSGEGWLHTKERRHVLIRAGYYEPGMDNSFVDLDK